ncbi:MAG: DNRLRE domain-containing protein, partial [Terriglobia bacterium]
MKPRYLHGVPLLAALIIASPAFPGDPRLELYDGTDGATCKYFNAGARIAWRHPSGDWRDAAGQAQGETPFATLSIRAGGVGRVVEWDVTGLVRGWLQGKYPNSGLILATLPGPRSDTATFGSREGAEAARPRLTIAVAGEAQTTTLAPIADAWLDCSTAYALGTRNELRVGSNARSVLQFDLAALAGRRISQATLTLTTVATQAFGSAIGVFRLDPPVSPAGVASHSGIASAYPRDAGIAKNPDVLFATGFESPSWHSEWSYLSEGSHADR